MALVEGEDLAGPMAAGDRNDGRVCKADAEVWVLLDQAACLLYVASEERRESVGLGSHLSKQLKLGIDVRQLGNHAIELREDKGREKEQAFPVGQDTCGPRVAPLVRKEGRQKAAGVNHDHRSLVPEFSEQLVDAIRGFGVAKPATSQRNTRSGASMSQHLLRDCLADQLRLRGPGVTRHASQRGPDFGWQIHGRLLHAIRSTRCRGSRLRLLHVVE